MSIKIQIFKLTVIVSAVDMRGLTAAYSGYRKSLGHYRDAALSSGKGTLYRNDSWAYLKYSHSDELYDMKKDLQQYTNLVDDPAYADVLVELREKLQAKISEVEQNDLGRE